MKCENCKKEFREIELTEDIDNDKYYCIDCVNEILMPMCDENTLVYFE
jgi:DNA-directed RNA polymerase subunit RPC12/RpoP